MFAPLAPLRYFRQATATNPVPSSTRLAGSGTGLWNMNPKVVAESVKFTVSVPAVGWKNVGSVKSAAKKHPEASVQEYFDVGILRLCPPMLSVYASVNVPSGATFV